ncbi:MAG: hypothetical protein DRI71_01040 [Bacteroidetes bacterium]|nr:MAG: hypothetical protein DRI71_01040 [Bacteroidota bacterium]
MEIREACYNILDQVGAVIEQISDEEFVRPVQSFNGATIGQHFRHSLEFFQCLVKGYPQGAVSYDKRQHDKNLESNKILALDVINTVKLFIEHCDVNKAINLYVSYDPQNDKEVVVSSNMAREITYNIEHIVHHMALVKIGIKEVCPSVELPAEFGIAVSTIKYHKISSEG